MGEGNRFRFNNGVAITTRTCLSTTACDWLALFALRRSFFFFTLLHQYVHTTVADGKTQGRIGHNLYCNRNNVSKYSITNPHSFIMSRHSEYSLGLFLLFFPLMCEHIIFEVLSRTADVFTILNRNLLSQ